MTNQDEKRIRGIARAIVETVKDCGKAPEGILYAGLAGEIGLQEFNMLVGFLVDNGILRRTGYHELELAK